MPLVRAIQNTGAVTLEAITCALNDRGVRPMRVANAAAAQPEGSLLVAADAQAGCLLDSPTANPSSVP
jgi:hypothetical protein